VSKIEREVADAISQAARPEWTKVKVRAGWPETWERRLRGTWYTLEKQRDGWSLGYSHRRGDSDSVERGSRFPTWEAATVFAEEHAGH